MSVTIRTVTTEDKARCLALLSALNAATGGTTSSDAGIIFDSLLDLQRGQILVAQDDQALLGLASLSFNLAMRYGGEYCQLEELIVDPDARGKNVGALLMTEAVNIARLRGCAEFGLYLVASTEHNQAFYEKFGFIRVGSEMRQAL
jgi:GNAT superfamily N-acetyltransferase